MGKRGKFESKKKKGIDESRERDRDNINTIGKWEFGAENVIRKEKIKKSEIKGKMR